MHDFMHAESCTLPPIESCDKLLANSKIMILEQPSRLTAFKEYCKSLIYVMRRGMQEVIKSGGGHTGI